jgi:hypothetical protein
MLEANVLAATITEPTLVGGNHDDGDVQSPRW